MANSTGNLIDTGNQTLDRILNSGLNVYTTVTQPKTMTAAPAQTTQTPATVTQQQGFKFTTPIIIGIAAVVGLVLVLVLRK